MDVAFFVAGQLWLLDFAATYPLKDAASISAASASAGGAAAEYEKTKFARYGGFLAPNQILKPLVVDIFGAWSPSAAPVLRVVAAAFARRHASGRLGEEEALIRINAAVAKGVAALLLNHSDA
jgi:hypothetical protein